MSYIYQWDILETEVSNYDSRFPDNVKRIKFAFVAYDVDSQGDETTYIMKDIYLPNPNQDSFIPFSELKHSDFVKFIVDTCGPSDIEYMKNSMIAELEDRKNKKIFKKEVKSPWAQEDIVIQQNIIKFDNQVEYLLSENAENPII